MSQKGTSLVELLMVIVVVASVVLLLANLPNAFILISKSKHLSLARELMAKQIEDKRAISYINLVNGTTTILDTRLGMLPNGSGTVLVEDCNVLICTNAEHVKQVTVTVNWKEGSKNQTINLKTFIGEGGLDQ